MEGGEGGEALEGCELAGVEEGGGRSEERGGVRGEEEEEFVLERTSVYLLGRGGGRGAAYLHCFFDVNNERRGPVFARLQGEEREGWYRGA